MPRNISTALSTHLRQDYTTLVCCWRLDLVDGTSLGFTNHTRDLVIGGLTYSSGDGINPSGVTAGLGTDVDNLEVQSIIDSVLIVEEDLLTGRYDYARLTVSLVNYMDLTMGSLILHLGYIGEVSFQNGMFVAENRSFTQLMQQEIGDLTSPTCRVKKLGFDGCHFNLSGNTADGYPATQHLTVATGTSTTLSRKEFTTSYSGYDGIFQYGTVQWTSGANLGQIREVKSNVAGVVILYENLPHDIGAGDGITMVVGCDRTPTMCSSKFNNILNYRGEPYVPGLDQVLSSPQQ